MISWWSIKKWWVSRSQSAFLISRILPLRPRLPPLGLHSGDLLCWLVRRSQILISMKISIKLISGDWNIWNMNGIWIDFLYILGIMNNDPKWRSPSFFRVGLNHQPDDIPFWWEWYEMLIRANLNHCSFISWENQATKWWIVVTTQMMITTFD